MPPEWCRNALLFDPVLVVTSERGTAAAIAQLLRGFGPAPQVIWAGSEHDAWRHFDSSHPKLIFLEQAGRVIDGLVLTKRLRRSPFASRSCPVVMLSNERTVAALRDAQNAGASEFLTRPFSAGDLARRLEAVCTVPRDWIEAETYIGPDRRRFNSAAKGPERRARKAATVRLIA